MEHIAAILLLVGCSDGTASCHALPAPVPMYETAEDCQADIQSSIGLYTTKVPQVFAQCVAIDPAMEEADAELVWDVTSDGNLVASIETSSGFDVASAPTDTAMLTQQR